MTGHDIMMTEIVKTANVLRKEPSQRTTPKTGLYRNLGKRVLDTALILLSAPIIVPIVLAIAILVARDGGKPFYSQKRIGKGGHTFNIWKLRTLSLIHI